MTAFLKNILDNPILTRELRRRMRGKALMYSIIGYIMLMSGVTIMLLLLKVNPLAARAAGDTQALLDLMTDTGRSLYIWITAIQALLVLIIAPTITAGMTTGEKERQTFDFLRVTTITPWMYISGCFLSTVFYVGLALICAMPLLGLTFLYGGVGPSDLLKSLGTLFTASLILSAFGLYISSVRDRTRTAQGIVVFVIFAAVFGSLIGLDQIRSWLGTASAAATSAAGGSAAFFTENGRWLVGYGIGAFVAMVFLLVATRKLFDPGEVRAFGHAQFAVVALLIMGGLWTYISFGNAVTNYTVLGFLTTGCILLMIAAINFGVGRMEVGDEIWHLKRLFPFLRFFDQTIPYLVCVGLLWFWAGIQFMDLVAPSKLVEAGMIRSVLLVSLSGFAFLCVFGRYATAVAVGRSGAGRLTLGVAIALWVVVPILVLFTLAGLSNKGSAFGEVCSFLGRLSPFYVMVDGTNNQRLYAGGDALSLPGFTIFVVYSVLTVIFLVLGELLRYRRWKGFDYHYDMPKG